MHIAFYERVWLAIAAGILVLFLAVVTVGAMANLGQMPGHSAMVDPATVTQSDPRFSQPRVEQSAPGVYEAYVVARMFSFAPAEIRVPAGAKVNFHVTSPDVLHGFQIANTNINVMVAPGYVSDASTRFTKPGEYLILCNEYCGIAHQVMAAKLIVE